MAGLTTTALQGQSGAPEHVVDIPYRPRQWARAFHASLRRFAVMVLHRRAGKTTATLHHHQRAALDDGWERARLLHLRPSLTDTDLRELMHPPGGRHYGHLLPLRSQAKTAAWDMLKSFAAPIPGRVVNEAELLIRYPNGNKLQLFGADNPDAFRSIGFSGVSFDEYSQMVDSIYSEVISKGLGDHLGYAIFEGTIKGKDHLYRMFQASEFDPEWFALWQDVDQSLATETGITIQVLEDAMEDDRKQIAKGLMSQDTYDQEWFLSADASIQGAWFAKEMAAAKAQERITRVPHEPALPVDTDWDLGIDDAMTIWFSQSLRSGEVRLIDYYEASGEGFPHYVGVLAERRAACGYIYGRHWAPHDIKVREMGTGKSRREVAAGLGLVFEYPRSPLGLAEGISAARMFLAKCWFDGEKCARGIECLRHYRKRKNTQTGEYTGTPVHNFASHGADAFRGLAVRHQVPEREIEAMEEDEFARFGGGGPAHGWMS